MKASRDRVGNEPSQCPLLSWNFSFNVDDTQRGPLELPDCPNLAVLVTLSFSDCPALAVLLSSVFPVLAVLF
jgi:hypothetical protein